jgi:hypothetical protein
LTGCAAPVNRESVPVNTNLIQARCIVVVSDQAILSSQGCTRLRI